MGSLVKPGVRLFHLHGDNDIIVPLERNSGRLVSNYLSLGGDARLEVIRGAGHEEIDAYFKSANLIGFIVTGAFPKLMDENQTTPGVIRQKRGA